jgi:hypothetical protein
MRTLRTVLVDLQNIFSLMVIVGWVVVGLGAGGLKPLLQFWAIPYLIFMALAFIVRWIIYARTPVRPDGPRKVY